MPEISHEAGTLLLRVCFILGAVTDGLAVVPMLSPRIADLVFGGGRANKGPDYRYAMGIGAALMAGWTLLLIWGAIDPWPRRELLLLTLFPVVAGIIAATIQATRRKVVRLDRMIPLLIHLGFINVLYLSTYLLTSG